MPLHEIDGKKVWRRRDRKTSLLHFAWISGVALVTFICLRAISAQTTWSFVWSAPEQLYDLADRMVPPKVSYLPSLISPLIDTIHIATLGTIVGIVFATPLAFLAARNTTPLAIFRPLALLILVTSRSVNSIIWALLLVVILGPGMLSGILAIALRSVGFLGKLLYEAIEEIDENTVEAVSSTGASRGQTLIWGVVPQIMPTFIGVSIYRWDINIREATVLGLVGAGGIGMALQASIDSLAWSQVTVIFLLILGTVVLSESVSARARKAVT